jgi:hypothetical protein
VEDKGKKEIQYDRRRGVKEANSKCFPIMVSIDIQQHNQLGVICANITTVITIKCGIEFNQFILSDNLEEIVRTFVIIPARNY